MSIEINWETLTSGPDGLEFAETIRSFIHEKFQHVPLPRFIRSVRVISFDFGTVAPEVVLKDICDPLPDFYEDDDEYDDDESEDEDEEPEAPGPMPISRDDDAIASRERRRAERQQRQQQHQQQQQQQQFKSHKIAPEGEDAASAQRQHHQPPPYIDTRLPGFRSMLNPADPIGSPILSRSNTPGIPGGTSNLNYFHLPLGASLSGTQTPLAAVAGAAQFPNGVARPDRSDSPLAQQQQGESPGDNRGQGNASHHQYSTSSSSLSPPSTANSAAGSRAPTVLDAYGGDASLETTEQQQEEEDEASPQPPRIREKRASDVQVISRVKYAGDVRLSLTAEILLDYPMPSFVGIPLKLNITGLTFDGVAITAYIRKRAHFCFLHPEDAEALIGAEEGEGNREATSTADATSSRPGTSASSAPPAHGINSSGRGFMPTPTPSPGPAPAPATTTTMPVPPGGGLLREIKVESEIGQKENGKQVLKNVGKVERFVLEQVRRIFEREFVYPNYWTFLV
ncbi:MAG: hypothetical protein M1819_000649 [Sarea resinae]|nr:MAG: hypothetical protein M1819_000649 [Sarea resinae]